MLNFLRRLFGRGDSEGESTEGLLRQLEQMRGDLGAELPLEDLRPVLIPSSILSGGEWFGPHHYFEDLPLSLTWAHMRPQCTMQYLSTEHAEKMTTQGIDWRTLARNALLADSKARTWTFRRHPDHDAAAAAVLQDELGASRLLCLDQIDPMFPNGFSFFVPNRYGVFLLAEDAPKEIRDSIAKFVRQAYKEADVPMSLEPFSHTVIRKALIEAEQLSGDDRR
jgi:hypothetical protein